MSKKTEVKKEIKEEVNSYYIKRENSGYSVYLNNKKMSEENVLSIAFMNLQKLIKKDLGL